YDEVVSIENKPGEKIVSTRSGEYSCTALILAFGKTPRDLGVPGEQELKGHGVSYCAVCDGPIFKNRVVSVAGVGDHALQAAVYLAGVASKVNLILPGSEVRGDDSLVSAVNSENKIVKTFGRKVKSIKGEKSVKSLLLQKSDGSEAEEVQTDALFVEMGYIARTDFIKGIV
ncbi:thioredoxin-disulfide reductase, partial [mine drainage metagenome]